METPPRGGDRGSPEVLKNDFGVVWWEKVVCKSQSKTGLSYLHILKLDAHAPHAA